jgi:hypothetical protein
VSPQWLKGGEVRARKQHLCRTCGAVAAEPGETYRRDTYLGDGAVYDWVTCLACSEITGAVCDWVGYPDSIGADDYAAWAADHRHDEVWGEKARAFRSRLGIVEDGAA